MTTDRWTRIGLVLAAATVLMAGCSRSGASPADSDPAETAAVTEPSATASPTIERPSQVPSSALVTEPPIVEPPAAAMAVEGGDSVVGQLGSFTWKNAGSDAPWLDGSPIHVGAGERLTMTMAAQVQLSAWTVRRQPTGAGDGIGAVGIAEGSGEPVTFDAPPPGSWTVNVDVWFGETLGSASYFWLVEVD